MNFNHLVYWILQSKHAYFFEYVNSVCQKKHAYFFISAYLTEYRSQVLQIKLIYFGERNNHLRKFENFQQTFIFHLLSIEIKNIPHQHVYSDQHIY